MGYLHSVQPQTKYALLLLLALAIAAAITVFHPRSASAEGSLLDTARCLVRGVLQVGCQKQPAPQSSVQSERVSPSSSNGGPAGESSATTTPPSTQSRQRTTTHSTAPIVAPLPVQELVAKTPIVDAMPAIPQGKTRIDESQFVAYFNAFSPYAVQGAATQKPQQLVERTAEGWKIAGVPWYGWASVAGLVGMTVYGVRRFLISRGSVLPGGR